jgi:hypothetical protein
VQTVLRKDFWFGPDLVEPLVGVNVHCLELLRERVRRGAGEPRLPRLLADLAPAWAALTDAAIASAARCPYALVEGSFADLARWRAGAVRESATAEVFFDQEQVTSLLHEVAVLAWHLARSHRHAARLMLGMTPASIDLVAGCTLRELQTIAQTHAFSIQPRWADRPAVWQHTLAAAAARDAAALGQARLRGLQLLAAEAAADSAI